MVQLVGTEIKISVIRPQHALTDTRSRGSAPAPGRGEDTGEDTDK